MSSAAGAPSSSTCAAAAAAATLAAAANAEADELNNENRPAARGREVGGVEVADAAADVDPAAGLRGAGGGLGGCRVFKAAPTAANRDERPPAVRKRPRVRECSRCPWSR